MQNPGQFSAQNNTLPEISIEVQDIGRVWKASDVQDLSRQLRELYPDGAFERTLKCVRDPEAEERRESALNELAQILVEAGVRRMLETDGKRALGAASEPET
jgi:hypothetical protein